MNIQELQLKDIRPAAYNPRTITKDEFEGLKASILTFGQQENLIVNKDMTLISGHQRLAAMLALGWTKAICNVVDLDKHAEKKLNVIMNSAAISGSYDDLRLSEILEELKLDDNYETLRLDKLEPLDLSELDYGILDDKDVDAEMNKLADNVKKAIQIEFTPDDYEVAFELVKQARTKGVYVGKVLMNALEVWNEKT